MMMIGSDDRVKIVLHGINSKMADVSLTSLLLAGPHLSSGKPVNFCVVEKNFIFCSHFVTKPLENAMIQSPGSDEVDDFRGSRQDFSGLLAESLMPVHADVENGESR